MTLTVLHDNYDQEMIDTIEEWLGLFEQNQLVLIPNGLGTGDLRNRVISISEDRWGRGKYLYIGDNDTWHHRDWSKHLTACYDAAWNHGFRVIGAYNHPFHLPIRTFSLFSGWHVREVQALATQSMLMRWEVWDRYGPFVETPVGKVRQSEDVAFTNKIRADGGRIGVVSPALVVNTGITDSFGERIPGWELVKKEAPQGVIVE